MVRLKPGQRRVLAEKLPDLGNLFAGGFVIAQFFERESISGWLLVVGFAMWFAFMGLALLAAEAGS